jgi:hypothetical protein
MKLNCIMKLERWRYSGRGKTGAYVRRTAGLLGAVHRLRRRLGVRVQEGITQYRTHRSEPLEEGRKGK